MKKIMYLIALFAFLSIQLFAQLQNPADTVGTLITSAIRPNSQADNIATIYTNEARGTTHHYQTWAELQAMKSSRLVPYMLATVADSAGKLFQYDGSSWAALQIDNTNNAYLTYEMAFDKMLYWDMQGNDVAGASANQSEIISTYFTNNSSSNTISFPASWKWIGVKPTQLAADEEGILTLQNYSATIIVAKYEILN